MSKNKYCPKYGKGFEFILSFSFKRLKSNSIEVWQKGIDLRQSLDNLKTFDLCCLTNLKERVNDKTIFLEAESLTNNQIEVISQIPSNVRETI